MDDKRDGGFEPFDKETKTGSPDRREWPTYPHPQVPKDGINYPGDKK